MNAVPAWPDRGAPGGVRPLRILDSVPEEGRQMDEIAPSTRRKRTPIQRFRDFLSRQGFRPWVEDESPASIWFKFEGLKYAARLEDRDEDYVQIALGFTLREESRDELTLLRTMNEVQASTKVVKIYVSPGSTSWSSRWSSSSTATRPA